MLYTIHCEILFRVTSVTRGNLSTFLVCRISDCLFILGHVSLSSSDRRFVMPPKSKPRCICSLCHKREIFRCNIGPGRSRWVFNREDNTAICGKCCDAQPPVVPPEVADLTTQVQALQTQILRLQNRVRALESNLECPVCLDRHVSVALGPCGHLVCLSCQNLPRCPICRVAIEKKLRLYYV